MGGGGLRSSGVLWMACPPPFANVWLRHCMDPPPKQLLEPAALAAKETSYKFYSLHVDVELSTRCLLPTL